MRAKKPLRGYGSSYLVPGISIAIALSLIFVPIVWSARAEGVTTSPYADCANVPAPTQTTAYDSNDIDAMMARRMALYCANQPTLNPVPTPVPTTTSTPITTTTSPRDPVAPAPTTVALQIPQTSSNQAPTNTTQPTQTEQSQNNGSEHGALAQSLPTKTPPSYTNLRRVLLGALVLMLGVLFYRLRSQKSATRLEAAQLLEQTEEVKKDTTEITELTEQLNPLAHIWADQTSPLANKLVPPLKLISPGKDQKLQPTTPRAISYINDARPVIVMDYEHPVIRSFIPVASSRALF